MKRQFSSVLLIVYWVALPIMLLMAISVTIAALLPSGITYALPRPVVITMAYIVPALLAWRLWVLIRARRTASAVVASEPETGND